MDKRIVLLRVLVHKQDDLLLPQTNLDSFCGYWFPEAQSILATQPGQEIATLDDLAEKGCLERQGVNKVHLCPFCQHFAVNFREVCPQCDSNHITMVPLLHHLRCGYVAPQNEFRLGLAYICPKCRQELRYRGVDYERPTSSYLCTACGQVFSEPQISCLSLQCKRTFGIERAEVRTIYAYRLTEIGRTVAARGTLADRVEVGSLLTADCGLYTRCFVEERLAQEVRRVQRHGYPLALLMLSPDRLDAYAQHRGREAAARLLKSIALIVKESLRDCDLAAFYSQCIMTALLPDTTSEGAYRVAERLRQQVPTLMSAGSTAEVTLSIGVARFTPDMTTANQMVALGLHYLQEAQHAGGNCLRPALAMPETCRQQLGTSYAHDGQL